MIVQAAVAGVAGVAVVGRLAWTRLSSPMRRKGKADGAPTADTIEQQQ
jgi:hypothetical protein